MNREDLFHQLRVVSQSVVGLFRLCPVNRLDFRPAARMRSLLDLGNHFASVPLVDLAALQGSPRHVVEAIEETLHGAGPQDWTDIFERGARAMDIFTTIVQTSKKLGISAIHL